MELTGIVKLKGKAEPFVKMIASTLEGKPLPDAKGTQSDMDGKFKINVPDDAKYFVVRHAEGQTVQKINPNLKEYDINLDFKQSQTLNEVEVTAKTPATQCSESGGTWIPSTAGSKTKGECKTKPQVKTKKLNIKKYLIIGGILLVVLGTAGYFIVKKVKSK